MMQAHSVVLIHPVSLPDNTSVVGSTFYVVSEKTKQTPIDRLVAGIECDDTWCTLTGIKGGKRKTPLHNVLHCDPIEAQTTKGQSK